MNNNLLHQDHEQLMVLTTLITFLVPKKETSGKYAMWGETIPPLAGPPPHSHPDEEVFYVLSGDFEFLLHDPEKPVVAKAGDVMHIPGNALHTYRNIGDKAGRLLTMVTPGSLEDYFRTVGKPVYSEKDIPDLDQVPDFTRLDVADFIAQAPAHGVVLHLPESV